MGKFIDLTGNKYGKLLVLNERIYYIDKQNKQRFKWKCQCDCGNICYVDSASLKRGNTRSCGCLQKQIASENGKNSAYKHGMSHTRLFRIWYQMIDRCENAKNKLYPLYGERGISVCEEWHNSTIFFEWALSNGYKDTLSIDRIDVNGNYEPFNCRWATQKIQCNNTRRNRMIVIGKETHTVAEWSDKLNIPYGKIYRVSIKCNHYETIESLFNQLLSSPNNKKHNNKDE